MKTEKEFLTEYFNDMTVEEVIQSAQEFFSEISELLLDSGLPATILHSYIDYLANGDD